MSKKNWISVKRGLSEDPKHRQAMGEAVWLFLHILDAADWEKGIVYDWRDAEIACEMSLSQRTVRDWRQRLQDAGYIRCEQRQHSLDVIIHNWTDPRSYSGKVLNKKQGDTDMSPEKIQGDTQGDTEGDTQGTRETRANPSSSIESTSKSTSINANPKKSVHVPEGFPEPTGDIVGDWAKIGAIGDAKARPFKEVAERLSVLNRHWPKYGENQKWDHLARQIVEAEKDHPGMVEEFVTWVHKQKDPSTTIKYYGARPDYIWNDIGLCFSEHKQLTQLDIMREKIAQEEREYKEAHGCAV